MKVIKSFRMDNGSVVLCENKSYGECVNVILENKELKKINDNLYAGLGIRYAIKDD